MTFDSMMDFKQTESGKGYKNKRAANREMQAAHRMKQTPIKHTESRRQSVIPAMNGDVRSGFIAVSGEWWRNGAAIGAPKIDTPDRKRHLAKL